jgi:ATP-dependent protease ClpP protease subunit
MRAARSEAKPKPWFRVENAFKGEGDKEVTPVYIYDEIGDSWFGGTSAADFIKMIGTIETAKIELHLNSPGGDIFDGVAIYNALHAHPAEVDVIVDALAASAASFIAQAGDTVTMTKGSMMMIHDGSGMVWGNASDMRTMAELLDKLSNNIASIYADRAGQSTEFWRNLMIEEVWYDAQEAVDAGLADTVAGDTKAEDDAAAQNKWDLSVFNYAGRAGAPNPFSVRQRIANQLKENIVAKTTNTADGSGDGTQQETGSPATDPDAQTTEGTASDAQEEREDQSATGVPTEGEPAPAAPAAPATPPAPEAQPENKVTVAGPHGQPVFTLNGQQTSDFQAVQTRLDVLENFRDEAVKQSKIDFVVQLATDNKIGAPQIDSLTEYALGLDDAGYAKWKATWDVAAPLQMLGVKHGGAGVTNSNGQQTAEREKTSDQIDILKATIRQHQLTNMAPEKIMQTPSYKALMELEPTFKL